METSVKIGPKKRHLKIPEGWRIVTEGKVQRGDMFVDVETLCFVLVDEDEIGCVIGEPVEYECLVRRA